MVFFKQNFRKLFLYFLILLICSPVFVFGSMFATFLLCALFGEFVALTYLNIICFSFILTSLMFLGFMFLAKIVPKEDLKNYYFISFFLPFFIILIVFTIISLVFGIIL